MTRCSEHASKRNNVPNVHQTKYRLCSAITELRCAYYSRSDEQYYSPACYYRRRSSGTMCSFAHPVSLRAISARRLPRMTHLGTMLHFQPPTWSIITQPCTRSHCARPPGTARPGPSVMSAISRESNALASNPSLTAGRARCIQSRE